MTKEEFLQTFREQKIYGGVSDREAWLLHELARLVPPGGTVVEIGSWLGRSSIALAMGLRANAVRLHTVDDHRGIENAPPGLPSGPQAREMFFENLQRAGVRDLIEHHNVSSDDLAPQWKLPIDLLFVDGCHEYDAARRDTMNYAPHVKPGGVVIFHDVAMDSVWRTIKEWVGEKDAAISGVAGTANIVAFKLGDTSATGIARLRRAVILGFVFLSRREAPGHIPWLEKMCRKLLRGPARLLMRVFDWRSGS